MIFLLFPAAFIRIITVRSMVSSSSLTVIPYFPKRKAT